MKYLTTLALVNYHLGSRSVVGVIIHWVFIELNPFYVNLNFICRLPVVYKNWQAKRYLCDLHSPNLNLNWWRAKWPLVIHNSQMKNPRFLTTVRNGWYPSLNYESATCVCMAWLNHFLSEKRGYLNIAFWRYTNTLYLCKVKYCLWPRDNEPRGPWETLNQRKLIAFIACNCSTVSCFLSIYGQA